MDAPQFDAEAVAIQAFLTRSDVLHPATGQPISVPMTLGLGGGIGMMLFVFKYEEHNPTVGMITRHHTRSGKYTGFSDGVLGRSGGSIVNHHTSSPTVAGAKLISLLQSNPSALCWTMRSPVSQMSVPAIFDQLAPWLMVVDSVSEEEVSIFDPALGALKLDAREFARSRSAFKPINHRVTVASPDSKSPPLQLRILDAVRATCDNMLRPEMANFGLPALTKWNELLTTTTDSRGWRTMLASGQAHVSAMSSVYLAIRSGGCANRDAYAHFLDESAELLDETIFTEAATAFRASARMWSLLARGALSSDSQLLDSIRQAIDQRFALEQQSFLGKPDMQAMQRNQDHLNALTSSSLEDLGDVVARFTEMATLVKEIESIERPALEQLQSVIDQH